MIILKQTTTKFDGLNASPFCSKLELFLRYYQIPFSIKPALPMHGPYGKIPFIEYQGETLGDSELIIQQLLTDYNIDTGLTEKQQSQGRAWQLMLENHLYWVMVYCRWIHDAGWAKLEPLFFGALKWPLRVILARRTFICGDKFSHCDFFAYAVIKGINSRDMPTALTKVIQNYSPLDDYIQRVEAELERAGKKACCPQKASSGT